MSGYSGAGLAPSHFVIDVTTQLALSGIAFAPGRTIQISAGDGLKLTKLGKLWLLEFCNIGFRFGEAGSTSTMYFGLPSYVPQLEDPIPTSVARVPCLGGTGWVDMVVAADTYDSAIARQTVQMNYRTTALAAQNWPITPAAHAFVKGQVWFTTKT